MRWLREPLLHFVAIGAALFALYYQVAEPEERSSDRILISAADVDRISTLFKRKWQRSPSDGELDGLIEEEIREEILYREALAVGLDENDTIVRRRMAQKMEFMFDDVADAAEPTDEQLQRYLQDNPDKFREPARLSFVHVYFNLDERGRNAPRDAQRLLVTLRRVGRLPDPPDVGDSLMIGHSFDDQSEQSVARMFGSDFAKALSSMEMGVWHGPIVSGYGLHLVQVRERVAPRLPSLAEIGDSVRNELVRARRLEANEAFHRALRDRYTVVVERPPAKPRHVASGDSLQ